MLRELVQVLRVQQACLNDLKNEMEFRQKP